MERPAPDVGQIIGDKYRIDSVLGRGGMGVVYGARHQLTDRRVALKWMLPDTKSDPLAAERFLREARAMGRIDHPRVVSVLDVGRDGPATFIVMELLRGESLRARMRRDGALCPRDVVDIMLPALEGLAAAHRLGIVHRDLKPENLFLVPDGKGAATKLLDFGISKFRQEPGEPNRDMTQSGVTMGTPAYMSPEQVRGSRELDARTDVWAIGVILHELLAGSPPFAAESYGALLVAIATEAPAPLPSSVPADLAALVRRALEKSPDDRWASVEELAQALLPFGESGLSFQAAPMSIIPPAPSEPAPVATPATRAVRENRDAATRPAVPAKMAPPARRYRGPMLVAAGALSLVAALSVLWGGSLPHGVAESRVAESRVAESGVAESGVAESGVAASPVRTPPAPSEPASVPTLEPARSVPTIPAAPPAIVPGPGAVALPAEPTTPAEADTPRRERPRRDTSERSSAEPSPVEAPRAPDEPAVRGRSGALSREEF